MSSVKDYMHELWSHVDVEVTFTCPLCRNPTSAWLKIPGDQSEHYEKIACEFDDDQDGWTVITRHDEHGYWSAELAEDPTVEVTLNVDKRHDCVHRNGVNKEGNTHNDITREYLLQLSTIFENIAENLESAIQEKKFFERLDGDDFDAHTQSATVKDT